MSGQDAMQVQIVKTSSNKNAQSSPTIPRLLTEGIMFIMATWETL